MTFTKDYLSGHLVLPASLYFHYHEIFDNAEDFLIWQFCYLQATTSLSELLPSQIAQSLGKETSQVTAAISRLTAKQLLAIKTIEVGGEIETIFDPSPVLERLEALLQPAQAPQSGQESPHFTNGIKSLVEDFERELGRQLSPFELEELQKLLKEQQTPADLIREALKEAVLNDKRNWKYIQAILRNWRQEGIVTLRQIEERRQERENKTSQPLQMDDDFRQMLAWSEEAFK